eukprot:556625-Pelagomonas_calceolata.AAC.4
MSNKRRATGQLAAGLLPHDGSLPLIVERVYFWHMGGQEGSPCACCGPAVHALFTACARECNWSAWVKLYSSEQFAKRPGS